MSRSMYSSSTITLIIRPILSAIHSFFPFVTEQTDKPTTAVEENLGKVFGGYFGKIKLLGVHPLLVSHPPLLLFNNFSCRALTPCKTHFTSSPEDPIPPKIILFLLNPGLPAGITISIQRVSLKNFLIDNMNKRRNRFLAKRQEFVVSLAFRTQRVVVTRKRSIKRHRQPLRPRSIHTNDYFIPANLLGDKSVPIKSTLRSDAPVFSPTAAKNRASKLNRHASVYHFQARHALPSTSRSVSMALPR